MVKVAVGSIPEKITYVFSDTKEVAVGCEWDIDWRDDQNKTIKQIVTPAFPVDSKDENSMTKAINWAKSSTWDYVNNVRKTKIHNTKETDNLPLKNVKVLSLEHRGEGGRAYKVLIDDFYVDLREDVLMDTILKSGIDIGGILKGEYVWAKVGSQMKLIRVGSELHKLILEFSSKKDIKPVGKNNLEIGGLYQDKKKNKAIFIGYVDTTKFNSKDKMSGYQSYMYNNKKTELTYFNFEYNEIKKGMLFYTIPSYEKEDDVLKNMKTNSYKYEIKKSHTYIEKINQLNIPNDIIEYLRETNIKDINENILEYIGNRPPKQNYRQLTSYNLKCNIAYASAFINLYRCGDKDKKVFDMQDMISFCLTLPKDVGTHEKLQEYLYLREHKLSILT